MKALVMGGTEFVGSAMAKYLILKGYDVDIFTRGMKPVKYEGIGKHLIGDRKSVEDLKKNISSMKYDYVFDISAYTKQDVEKLVSTLNRDNLKRYVLCSSGSVYIPSDDLVSEVFTRGENENWGAYGLNKKEAEDYLFELWKKEKFPFTLFRPTYIYGEGNNLYREAYLFDRTADGIDIPIPGGDKTTQFIYISDLVKMFESAVHTDNSLGQAYNATHPEFVTWQKLVETAGKVVNKQVTIKKVDEQKTNLFSREYFPFRNVNYMLDTKKLEHDGVYVPQIDLYHGLKLAYNWYIKTKPEISDSRMSKIDEALFS